MSQINFKRGGSYIESPPEWIKNKKVAINKKRMMTDVFNI